MTKIDLKKLVVNYTDNLCRKTFKYVIHNKTKNVFENIIIRFYIENCCHLLGLQHIFGINNNDYLGEKGYNRIIDEKITIKSMKKHDAKQYNYIKIKLEHFDEIYDIMLHGELIKFNKEICKPRSKIRADFVLFKDNKTYILHLFLKSESPGSEQYAVVSFVVNTIKDDNYKHYIDEQEYKKISDRSVIKNDN